MKKNVLKLASLAAGLCIATTLTSCHNGEDAQTTLVPDVVQQEARLLTVHTNVSAKVEGVNFSFSYTGTDAVITNAPVSGSIKISADGRQTKTIQFNFKDGAVLYYDIFLESTGTVFSQTDVETNGVTVTNGDNNKNDNDGVEASFSLGTETNTGTTGSYSITVFTPAQDTSNENIAKGQNLTESPLAIDCKPDGAVFSNPIDVVLNIPGSAGYNVGVQYVKKDGSIEKAGVTPNGDEITAKIPHFSVWDVILALLCDNYTPTTKNYDDVSVNAMNGQTTVTVDFGYETDNETVKSPIAKRLLKKMFGTPYKQITKTVKWNAVEGTATVKTSQAVNIYEFSSGEKTVKVTVYGKVTTKVSIETAQPQEVKTHGGGSN